MGDQAKKSIPMLLEYLQHKDRWLRWHAATALVNIEGRDSRIERAFCSAIKIDEHESVLKIVMHLLTEMQIQDEQLVVNTLTKILVSDPRKSVSEAAAKSLFQSS